MSERFDISAIAKQLAQQTIYTLNTWGLRGQSLPEIAELWREKLDEAAREILSQQLVDAETVS